MASSPRYSADAAASSPATTLAAPELSPSSFPPGSNWAARQFINIPLGASSSDGSFGKEITKGQGNGSARTLATFIPVPPCRLVDTRGLFNPVYTGLGLTNRGPTQSSPFAD